MNTLKPTMVGSHLFSALVTPETALWASPLTRAVPDGVDRSTPAVDPPADAARGSARRKLWDLAPGAACPVTGVCLQFADLYKLARKAGLPVAGCSEYDVHVQIVGECRRRSDMAARVQRLLDERYARHIKQAHQNLHTDADLAHWWDQSCMGADWAGVLWAVLTHPRCSAALEHVVLGQVHMLQHQVGMASRADHARLKEVLDDNMRLTEALELTQQRLQAARQTHARDTARQQADAAQLRNDLIVAQTERDQANTRWQALTDRAPGLLDRQTLADDNARLLADNRQLRRELAQATQAVARPAPTQADAAQAKSAHAVAGGQAPALQLADRAVLCVGGRTGGIPAYREVVEHAGARFLHHDGGDEERVAHLGSHLQAADVVICQVGCISHDAYWRVKEHCKRTGKPCLFVESSSRTALARALGQAIAGPAVVQTNC